MMPKSPSDNARNVPTTSAELDFSLVLARVIGAIENDPAQLRNAVYELARIKLEREVWQRHPPLSMTEIRHLMLSLDTAINCVESVSLRHDESRALRSLDRLIESSGTGPNHSISNERKPVLTFDQSLPAISDTTRVSTLVPSAARVARKALANGFRSRSVRLLAGSAVAVFGLAVYLVLQRPFGFSGPQISTSVEANAPASQKGDSAVPSPAIRQQTPAWPIPVTYGVYAISEGQLNELEPLGFRVPDPRVFMSTAIKSPSRTNLPDGRAVFIVFRRDIATTTPDRVTVRVIARIARAMTFNSTGPAIVTPLNEEWTMRSTSYELRVAPVIEHPEMVLFQPENPDFAFPAGRYALVLKGQAFDFTVSGPITDPAHCLERTEAANGAFYSECRNP
jgi:hypothetical protein